MSDLQSVSLWLDNAKVGCGYRHYLVLSKGRKWVSLLYCPTLTRIKVPSAEFDRWAEPIEINPKRLAASLKRRTKTFKKYGIGFPRKVVAEVIAKCKENA